MAPREPPTSSTFSLMLSSKARMGGGLLSMASMLARMDLHTPATASPQSPSPICKSYCVIVGSASSAALHAVRRAGMREGGVASPLWSADLSAAAALALLRSSSFSLLTLRGW